jgi:Domain of unknown function (DUF4279)
MVRGQYTGGVNQNAEQARQVALEEVRIQHLYTTQQFFRPHVLQLEEGKPKTTVLEEEDVLSVYFYLEHESYFLVMTVADDGAGLAVRGCRAEAGCWVYLSVLSETLHPDQITARLGLAPTEQRIMGEMGTLPDGRPRRMPHRKHNWTLDLAGPYTPGTFEDKLDALLNAVSPYAEAFRTLGSQCSVGIGTAYSGYREQMWGVHLTAARLDRMGALGASFDIDLYASGPDLADTDD